VGCRGGVQSFGCGVYHIHARCLTSPSASLRSNPLEFCTLPFAPRPFNRIPETPNPTPYPLEVLYIRYCTAPSTLNPTLQGYLAHKTPPPPVGPCSSPLPRDLWWALSYERGNPVPPWGRLSKVRNQWQWKADGRVYKAGSCSRFPCAPKP